MLRSAAAVIDGYIAIAVIAGSAVAAMAHIPGGVRGMRAAAKGAGVFAGAIYFTQP